MKNIAIRAAIVIGVFLGALFFMKYMTGHFTSGAAAMFCYSALLIVAVMATMITLSLPKSRLRTGLLLAVAVFTSVSVARDVIGVYNESALNNIDRGISGGFFYASAEVNPDSLDNDQTALEFDKACDNATAAQNAKDEAAALAKFKTSGSLEQFKIDREAIAANYSKAKEVCKSKGITVSSSFYVSAVSGDKTKAVYADYTTNSDSFEVPNGWKLVSSGEIPVNKPFTSIGTYKGKILILVSGKARIDSTMEEMSPDGLKGQSAASFFSMPGAPLYSAIGKINGRKVFVGRKQELNLSTSTTVQLGPNDEPGTNGMGYNDNGGSWSYKICKPA